MRQEDVEQWIAQQGGKDRVKYSRSTQRIANPAKQLTRPDGTDNPEYDPTAPATIEISEEKWTAVDAEGKPTDAVLHVRRRPDGSFDIVNQGDANPTKPAASSADESVSAPPNQQYIVTRKPDGTVVTTPNQNYRPDPVAAENARTEQELNKERQWNSDHGYGWVTHEARATQIRQQETQARADKSQERQVAAQEAQNQLARDRLQFDKDKANLPTVDAKDVPVNGSHYTRVTSITPQGATTIKNYGPDGKEIAAIPSEGAASVGGPPMPQMIVGFAEQALTTYHTALANDPTLTPAQREKRFQEAVQVANVAVQQAATQQREQESQRNAEYNVASTKLTYLQSSTDGALKFVSGLIGNLPAGSGLGGQAFAALMGLQGLQLKRSGIDSLSVPGTSSQRAQSQQQMPVLTAKDLNSSNALTAHNAAISEQLAAPPPQAPAAVAGQPAGAPVAAASAAVPGRAPVPAGGGPAEPPARGNIPAQPSSAMVPGAPSIVGDTGGPPVPAAGAAQQATTPGVPEASPIPSDMPPGYAPPMQTQTDPTIADPAYMQPQYAPPSYVINPREGDELEPGARPRDMVPGAMVQVPGEAPGVGVPWPNSDASVSKMNEWPALAAYGQPMPPPQANPSAPAGDMMAARAAQIEATPPWRLGEDDLAWAQQNGLMDRAMRVPSMGRSA